MNKIKFRLTSIGIAFFLTFANSLTVKAPDKYGSYNIYILDDAIDNYKHKTHRHETEKYMHATDNTEVIIPADQLNNLEIYKNEFDPIEGEICEEGFKTTVGELHKITKIQFKKYNYNDGAYTSYFKKPHDYSWLNYCNRDLDSLDIVVTNPDEFDNVNAFHSINNLSIQSGNQYASIEKLHFLRDTKIKHLKLSGMINYEYIYTLSKVDSIEIAEFSEANKLDIKKLDKIKELTLSDSLYNIALYINMKDVESLRQKGITVNIGKNNELENDFKAIDKELNDIIKSFNLNIFSSNEEKIEAVLVYCLERYTYDKTFETMHINKIEPTEDDFKPFYGEEKDFLYGALKNNSQICGNYAAMMYALLKRMGVDSYIIKSKTHAWDLIKFNDGCYWFVDPTWLDDDHIYQNGEYVELDYNKSLEVLKSGNKEEIEKLDWYKVNPYPYLNIDPDEDPNIGTSHIPINFPANIIKVKKEDALLEKLYINSHKYYVPIIIIAAMIEILDIAYLAKILSDNFKKEDARNSSKNRVNITNYNNFRYGKDSSNEGENGLLIYNRCIYSRNQESNDNKRHK